MLFVWLTATVGHFLLTARCVRRLGCCDSFDELAFATVVGGIGTLSALLHIVSIASGLTLTSALAVLVSWHAVLWIATRSTSAVAKPVEYARGFQGVAEILALTAVASILFTWVDIASQSSAVVGSDAAHYHVPVAANLALGGSPFDLPATPHPYPMAGSLVAAWFILPLGDPLIVDLAMCLPFLLLFASTNWIFRLTTGQSGLAWSSWLCFALFSTPLFRLSSLVSADLWFASTFVAVTAVLLSLWARRTSPLVAVLGSLALGLLLGTKTTGAAAAVLLLGLFLACELVRQLVFRRGRPSWPSGAWWAIPAAAALVLAAGGIWLVRNWYRFGSPVAPAGLTIFGISIFSGEPFEPSTYLSVFGDLKSNPAYSLAARSARYARMWLGGWFVTALWLLALLPVDLGVAWIRRREPAAVTARALLFLATVGVGGALVWLLVGAPFTSLEWTRGLSLRYALPVAALLPLVGFVALFPVSWRWYEDIGMASIALTVVIAGSVLAYLDVDPTARLYVNVPSVFAPWLAVAGVVCLTVRWASSRARLLTPVVTLTCVVMAASWTTMIAGRADREKRAATAREAHERSDFRRSVHPESGARDAYFVVLANEEAAGRQCRRRRFFALSRVDEPLMFQSAAYANQFYYAARDLDTTRLEVALGPCDYVVAAPAVLETDKGSAFIAALAGGSPTERVGAAGPFVILRRQ